MKRNTRKLKFKLRLDTETVKRLDDESLALVVGGAPRESQVTCQIVGCPSVPA
jgi:hypothetical protein